MTSLTLDLVRRVRPLVSRHTLVTPLFRSEWLSEMTGGEVFLKCENLQLTGSFKIRGGLAAVSLLTPEARTRGVVTASAGNHGLGLARAAALHDVPCTVVVSRTVPSVKVEGIRAEGATVLTAPFDGYDDTQAWALDLVASEGGTYVSAFEDAGVMAGNGGTTMLEILEQVSDLDAVIAPCGGGGLINGMGLVARDLSPGTTMVGVNTDASPGMWLSRQEGKARLRVQSKPTIAEGIEGGVGELTFELAKQFVDEVLVVEESTIHRAVAEIAERAHLVVEGSGAVGVAAVLEGLVPGGRVCIVLTGSNIDPGRFARLLSGEKVPAP